MNFNEINEHLKVNKYSWLITGAAGFIGSNLVEYLLYFGQNVTGLDNLSLGDKKNLKEVVENKKKGSFKFIKGDVANLKDCQKASKNIDFILHQAALGSIPRSIENPLNTNNANINGFLNMLETAKNMNIKSFVYASSSSTYGDHKALPKKEEIIGKPLNPYAITKYVNELYAETFSKHYDFKAIGLRYFNVFGRRQRINGDYAAVIPKWINNVLQGKEIEIYGDGETSRDFCYIDNVIQANILATFTKNIEAKGEIFNIAVNDQTSLNKLINLIIQNIKEINPSAKKANLVYKDFRLGDIRHSRADITKAKNLLEYKPTHTIQEGIKETIQWYLENLNR